MVLVVVGYVVSFGYIDVIVDIVVCYFVVGVSMVMYLFNVMS